MAHGKMVEEMC